MDRGAWQATVHGITESDMTEQLSKKKNNMYNFERFQIRTEQEIFKNCSHQSKLVSSQYGFEILKS